MSVFIFVTKDRPINVALPLDQLNHFAVETFYGQNIYKLLTYSFAQNGHMTMSAP